MKHDKNVTRYVGKLSNKLRRKIDAFPNSTSFSGTQNRVLHFLLSQTDDVFQKDIEEEYCLRPPTATQLLRKMEDNGLICRVPLNNDGRKKKIIVTEKAMEYKDIVMENITDLENTLVKDIPKDELEIFLKVTEKMIENLS